MSCDPSFGAVSIGRHLICSRSASNSAAMSTTWSPARKSKSGSRGSLSNNCSSSSVGFIGLEQQCGASEAEEHEHQPNQLDRTAAVALATVRDVDGLVEPSRLQFRRDVAVQPSALAWPIVARLEMDAAVRGDHCRPLRVAAFTWHCRTITCPLRL